MEHFLLIETAFFDAIKAGLWDKEVQLAPLDGIKFEDLYTLAEQQSVVGLFAAGIEHTKGIVVSKEEILNTIGNALQIEQRNKAMNSFIKVLMNYLNGSEVNTVLIKGQGVAQCYCRPLWRSAGDIDLFLDKSNYEKAKAALNKYAIIGEEDTTTLHQELTVEGWLIELHGTMHTDLSKGINRVLDSVQDDVFNHGGIRKWNNDGLEINLPSPDNDVILVFTHFINHFYIGGIGLRQICDWCRLLWTYQGDIDINLLKSRLREMGLMNEWKCFASFAVEYLGIPEEVMPLYESKKQFRKKAERIKSLIMEAGNFGHNKDLSFHHKLPRFLQPLETLLRRLGEFARLTLIFPRNAPKFFFYYVRNSTRTS